MQRMQRRRPHLKPTRSCRDWPTHFQVGVLPRAQDLAYLGTIQCVSVSAGISRVSEGYSRVAPLGMYKAGLADVDGGLLWV